MERPIREKRQRKSSASALGFNNTDGDPRLLPDVDEATPLFRNSNAEDREPKRAPASSSVPASSSSSGPRRRQRGRERQRQENTITSCAAIASSFLALFLCACVLVGFAFNITDLANFFPTKTSSQMSSATPSTTQFYDELGRFVLENYDTQPPFSDFLPALAGFYGKPVYAFYVNRGQGIASFGIKSKDFPMLEYNSANKAYQNTALLGFRTFIQGHRKGRKDFLVEPFSPLTTRFEEEDNKNNNNLPKRWMYIGSNEMQVQEVDNRNDIETNATFFVLPEEDFGAFVKRTTIRNLKKQKADELTISLLDGLPRMEPAGGPLNMWLKYMGRTLEGLMGVYFPYKDSIQMPFYRLSSQPPDHSYVHAQEAGHWCLSVIETQDGNVDLLPIIYDPSKIFGKDTTMLRPIMLHTHSVRDIIANPQYGFAKTASAFAALDSVVLSGGEEISISTYYGKADHILDVPVIARRLLQSGFSQYKMSRSREIIDQITAYVKTSTSHPLFDRHIQQMFLDNSLRGGIPNILGDVDDDAKMRNVNEDRRLKVFHLFSRIHGDLERDYNDFSIEPTFFSEGPGSFRDVAQNRRNDVVFNPQVGSFNIEMFLSLIQADGYNPLTIEAVAFTIDDIETCKAIAERAVGEADGHRAQREALTGILNGGPFRPGQLFRLMEEQHIELIISRQDFVDSVAAAAESNPLAIYSTGFWADHFTYILDLIYNFLEIFPDWEQRMLFDAQLPYFFSPAYVQPRALKYVLSTTFDGQRKHVRQLNATVDDAEKKRYQSRFVQRSTGWFGLEANWQHDSNGNVFKGSIMSKLVVLGVVKYATRDPFGIGLEYEAGRPGWNEANNGLPGMVGSGLPELIELVALLRYVRASCINFKKDVIVPVELAEFIDSIEAARLVLLQERGNWDMPITSNFTVPSFLFKYWDTVSEARELYRMKTKVTFSGSTEALTWYTLAYIFHEWLEEMERGIRIAGRFGATLQGDEKSTQVTPTYFSYNIVEWDATGELNGDGLPLVVAKSMEVQTFPLFLEGPTRMMKLLDAKQTLLLYEKVKESPLRDTGLGMYTISSRLKDLPVDMGRETAFAPGWLENQSVWLHMSYKFYLELLRHGLFDVFFEEMLGGGILPFMNSTSYGRSLMECSSFIASSDFEDPEIRGRGFLARLSGSTAEFMSMWVLMMLGPNTFSVDSTTGALRMQLLPALPRWLFDDTIYPGESVISFKLFGAIEVRYFHRRGNEDLFRVPATRYEIGFRDGQVMNVEGAFIPPPLSQKIRRVVFVSSIDVFFE
ncbi:hypothetical protein ACA910_010784 [Epithemia clementina (nom. ined.)]